MYISNLQYFNNIDGVYIFYIRLYGYIENRDGSTVYACSGTDTLTAGTDTAEIARFGALIAQVDKLPVQTANGL